MAVAGNALGIWHTVRTPAAYAGFNITVGAKRQASGRWCMHAPVAEAVGTHVRHVTEGARPQSRPFPKAAAAAAAAAAADCNNQQTILHHTVWYYTTIP
jgi:hypothetical protein